MIRIDSLFHSNFSGAVLAVPDNIKAIRVHYITVRPRDKTYTVILPRLCLKKHKSGMEFDSTPCPYCANTLGTVVVRFVMFNKFSQQFVQIVPSIAEKIHTTIVSPFDKFFGEVDYERSKSNVVSIAVENVQGHYNKIKSVTPIYVSRCDVTVPEELITPVDNTKAVAEADSLMKNLFSLLTDNICSQIIRLMNQRGYDDLNFLFKYADFTYHGAKVWSMCKGELTCTDGQVFDMRHVLHNDSKHLKINALEKQSENS